MTLKLDQLPGAPLPLVVGDELVVYRNGVPTRVKVASVATVVNNQLGATAAGLALLTAADVAAQKTILGIV